MNEPGPRTKTWSRWAKWLAPFAGGLVVAGVIAGISAWRTNEENEAKVRELFDTASRTYQQQAERQAQIDLLYEPCSEQWIQESTENTVGPLQTLVTLRDRAAVTSETRALLQKACTDGDLDAYCEGWAQVVKKWAAEDIGTVEDLERGCRMSVGLE